MQRIIVTLTALASLTIATYAGIYDAPVFERKDASAYKDGNNWYQHLGDKPTKDMETAFKEEWAAGSKGSEHPSKFTLKHGEVWLKKGARWAISSEALSDEDYANDGVPALVDIPVRVENTSWDGVTTFHFRGSTKLFYTHTEWTRYPLDPVHSENG